MQENGTFENIYTNFLFLDKTKFGAITNKINKNFKRTQIIKKIKNIFKINKTKKLPQANIERKETLQNGHTENFNKWVVENYKYPDLEEFNKNQQNIEHKPKTK